MPRKDVEAVLGPCAVSLTSSINVNCGTSISRHDCDSSQPCQPAASYPHITGCRYHSSLHYSHTRISDATMDRQGYIDPEETYHPQDAIGETIKAAGLMGGAGFAISAIQNSLSRQNIGALGVFTRYGSSIGYFGTKSRAGFGAHC